MLGKPLRYMGGQCQEFGGGWKQQTRQTWKGQPSGVDADQRLGCEAVVDHHARSNRRACRVSNEYVHCYFKRLHQSVQAGGHAAHGHALARRQRAEAMARQIDHPHLCVFGQRPEQIAPCVA